MLLGKLRTLKLDKIDFLHQLAALPSVDLELLKLEELVVYLSGGGFLGLLSVFRHVPDIITLQGGVTRFILPPHG